jgi:hypothetical protein
MPSPQNEGHLNVKTANRWFENVAKLEYLGLAAVHQNLIHENN